MIIHQRVQNNLAQHLDTPPPPPHPHPRTHTNSYTPPLLPLLLQGCSARCIFCCNPDTWALEGATPTTSQEVAAQVSKVAAYLRPNGGGVTCSGGEPLLQPAFVADLFRRCHAMGLTTCLDTSGQAATGQEGGMQGAWDKVLPHTDTVLLCIKHLNPGGNGFLVTGLGVILSQG
jgi:pyruvate formate lyase activating enzyme